MTPATHIVSEGSGPPLILIHGVGLDHTMWAPLVEKLRGSFTLIRYDLIGHGRSKDWPGPRTWGHFVEQLGSVLDHMGLARANLAGLSIGGLVVQAFAIERAERVERLAILNAVYKRTRKESAAISGRLEGVERGGMKSMADVAIDRWFPPAFARCHGATLAQIRATLLGNDVEAYLKAYRLFATSSSLDGRLECIRAPSLVLTGDEDPGSTVRMAREMAEAIPDSQIAVLRGVRHLSAVEAPGPVADQLRSFFAAVKIG